MNFGVHNSARNRSHQSVNFFQWQKGWNLSVGGDVTCFQIEEQLLNSSRFLREVQPWIGPTPWNEDSAMQTFLLSFDRVLIPSLPFLPAAYLFTRYK